MIVILDELLGDLSVVRKKRVPLCFWLQGKERVVLHQVFIQILPSPIWDLTE